MVQQTPFRLSISSVGTTAATLYLGQPTKPSYPAFWLALIEHLRANVQGIVDTIPAYCSLFVDCTHPEELQQVIDLSNEFSQHFSSQQQPFTSDIEQVEHDIPVCYHENFAPDLTFIAQARAISIEEVIAHHTAQTYQVYALGFIPGFAFLGYVDEQIASPRHQNPRSQVAAGSVGIAGRQTGIYPSESPGGWQIIGRTPLTLYDPDKEIYSLFNIADRVRFHAISLEAFQRWHES